MAANKKIAVDITATDEASEKLDHVADRVEQLDGKSVTIGIDAEGEEQVQATLSDVLGMVDRLGAEDAQIVLALQAAGVQEELTDVLLDIAKVTGTPAEIEIKIAKANELRQQFDQITGAIKEIENRKITVEARLSPDFEGDMDRALQNVQEFTDKVRQAGDEAVDITVSTKVDTSGIDDMRAQVRLLADDYREIAQSLRALQDRGGDLIHDEDIADAERLSAALQQAAVNGDQIGQRAGEGVRKFGEEAKSANSSASVLANTVGNTAQDFGQMGGVAGTAGVAIGQMAEYMTDAKAAGDSIPQIATNFGLVLGPVAALTIGMGLATSAIEAHKKKQEEMRVAVQATTDAFEEGIGALEGWKDALDESVTKGTATAGEALNLFMVDALEGAGHLEDVQGGFGALGLTFDQVGESMVAADRSFQTWATGILKGKGYSDEVAAAIAKVIDNTGSLESIQSLLGQQGIKWTDTLRDQAKALNEVDDAVGDLDLEKSAKEWLDQEAAIDGNTKAMVANARLGAKSQIEAMLRYTDLRLKANAATEEATEDTEENTNAVYDSAEAYRQFVDEANAAIAAMVAWSVKINDAEQAMRDLAAAQGELKAENLAETLDLGDDAIDTLASVQQINEDLRALAAWVKEEGIPNIFDPDDVDAAPFLAKISSLKGPIQEQVAQAFGEGGPLAAQAVAESFVKSLSEQTGIAPDDVRHLLGLDDLTIDIKIAIEQSEIDKARTQLELLTGIGGETPWTASVALALDAKAITGQQAQALIQPKLRDYGVTIPTELEVPDAEKVKAEAQRNLNAGTPLTIPVNLGSVSTMGLQYNPRAPGATVTNVTHNYVPGSPTTTVDLFNLSLERNGSRTNG